MCRAGRRGPGDRGTALAGGSARSASLLVFAWTLRFASAAGLLALVARPSGSVVETVAFALGALGVAAIAESGSLRPTA